MENRGTASPPPVALVVVGLGGVGSALVAGIEAARAHLAHPWGSLVEAGGAGRKPDDPSARPLRELAPFAELADLALGAFELKADDAYRASIRAGVVSRSLLDELRPRLRHVRAMRGAREAPTRRHLADAIAEDLRGFLAHNHCAGGVLVCTVPGPRDLRARLPFTVSELWAALEAGAEEVSPGIVYAAAAAQAGFSFVGAAPDAALHAPAVPALFAEAGLPIAGAGLLGPDETLRDALAQVVAGEGLRLDGSTSLTTRVEERGARLWGGPDRTQEMGLGSAWAGGALELSFELRGPLALVLAARALDSALLLELAMRAGRCGAQEWMSALFAAPLGAGAPRGAEPQARAAARARLIAELSALAAAALARATQAA